MNTIHQIQKMEKLHRLIKEEHTGTSEELAYVLGVSRRTVQSYLQEFRDYGADIGYHSMKKTYFYRNKFEIEFYLNIRVSVP